MLTDVTSSIQSITVNTTGAGYSASGGYLTSTGGGGTGLAGYFKGTATPGKGDIVITNGEQGYTSCPNISCPFTSTPTTVLLTSCTLSASGVRLGSTASLTANAYKGYLLSVDGSGERRKIMSYTTARVATVLHPFTDAPTTLKSRYTVRGCTGEGGSMACPNCPRIVRADVIDNGDSTYSASFTATRKGQYSVVTSLVNSGGVVATYYDTLSTTTVNDFSAGNPVSSLVTPTVDWSELVTGSTPALSLTNSEFGVRWVGFVRPSRAQQYTFHMQMPSAALNLHMERMKLSVDNSIVIQQWNSLASLAPSGTIAFGRGNGYYDISALYKCSPSGGNKCRYSLLWESIVSSLGTSRGRIRSDRLFQRLDVANPGLTLATAGVDSSIMRARCRPGLPACVHCHTFRVPG